MKKIMIILICVFGIKSQAQLIQGEIKINEQSKTEISLKSNKIVNLYANFREQKHKINFVFTGTNLALNEEKQEVVQFVFNTIVKKNGKIIGNLKRNPIPFFLAIC